VESRPPTPYTSGGASPAMVRWVPPPLALHWPSTCPPFARQRPPVHRCSQHLALPPAPLPAPRRGGAPQSPSRELKARARNAPAPAARRRKLNCRLSQAPRARRAPSTPSPSAKREGQWPARCTQWVDLHHPVPARLLRQSSKAPGPDDMETYSRSLLLLPKSQAHLPQSRRARIDGCGS
jgi:hypothetical protein